MINFESQHFQKLTFQEKQIDRFLISVRHDLKIAEESDVPDVVKCPYCSANVPCSLFFDDRVECPECGENLKDENKIGSGDFR